jgi:hypothetical protein
MATTSGRSGRTKSAPSKSHRSDRGGPPEKPHTFELVRYADISGVSGALRWLGQNPSTAVWPDLDSIVAVHGHCGATVVRWLDVSELDTVPPGTDRLPGEVAHNHAAGRREPVVASA